MKPRSAVITEARFDPKLKTYWVLSGYIALLASIIGIVLIPIWALVGPYYARRYFESLACILTERSVIVQKGIFVRTEKTIPLDKIQDFSLKEGPLLRRLGLARLNVETAGQSSSQGQAEAALIGVQDVYAFRDRVLEQCEKQREDAPAATESGSMEVKELLADIRDTLLRVEAELQRRSPVKKENDAI